MHEAPHACGSCIESTHASPPFAGWHVEGVAGSHVTPHASAAHEGAPVEGPETGPSQLFPHMPQLSGSVASDVQTPLHTSGLPTQPPPAPLDDELATDDDDAPPAPLELAAAPPIPLDVVEVAPLEACMLDEAPPPDALLDVAPSEVDEAVTFVVDEPLGRTQTCATGSHA